MSDGFRRVWPELRRDYDAKIGEDALLDKIQRYYDNGTLTDNDVLVIIDQLGLKKHGANR